MGSRRAGLGTGGTRFTNMQQALAQLHTSAWQRHATAVAAPAAEAAQPTLAVVGAGRGRSAQEVRMPPTLQCIEWLQELDSKFSQELLLKLQLLDRLALGMEPDQLASVSHLWSTQPNVTPAMLAQLEAVHASLTLE